MALVYVYLRIESDDDHIFEVPGEQRFPVKSEGSILDLLISAQNRNPSYAFSSRHVKGFGDVVTSVCGLFNDSEANKGWFFYTPPNQIVDGPLNRVELTSGMKVVARYEEFTRDEQKVQIHKTEAPKRKQ